MRSKYSLENSDSTELDFVELIEVSCYIWLQHV